jgi:hypothetical protein
MSRDHKSVLRQLEHGPVFLAQRSEAVAVLVSPELWDSMTDELSRMRRIIKGTRQLTKIRAGNYIELDNLDQELAAMDARSSGS